MADAVVIAPISPRTGTSFDAFKQVAAGVLGVGYAEAGPAVILSPRTRT